MLYEVPLPLKSLNFYQNIEKSTIYGDLKSKKKRDYPKKKCRYGHRLGNSRSELGTH